MSALAVRAVRNDRVGCWVARSDELPELLMTAATRAELLSSLRWSVPRLLRANRPDAPFTAMRVEFVLASHTEDLRFPDDPAPPGHPESVQVVR